MNACFRSFVLLLASVILAPTVRAEAPAATSPNPAAELTASDVSAWFDGSVPFALKAHDLAAALVVVVKDGDVLMAKGYGFADVAARTPVDPATTLFRPGSIAKTMTWTAVMQLVEQGKLDLDADVNTYLDFSIPPRAGQPITMRQLMTHTPGFEEVAKNLFVSDPARIDNGAWLKAWVPERVFAPGEVSAYSNYGAALAGYIVQRVSGQTFDDYIEQHLLQPLDMQHSTFRQPLPPALQASMAQSYVFAHLPPRPFELVGAPPAGSLSASGIDMAHYMIAQLALGRFGDAQILKPETARQMQSYEFRAIPGTMPIALGFPRMDRNGLVVLGHSGETDSFHSMMLLFPQRNVGVFLSVDGATDGGLRQNLITAFADRYFPAPPSGLPTLPSAREHGAALVGRYVTARTSVSSFLSAANLFAQPRIEMFPDGTLITEAFRDAAGKPRLWREVAPFVWEDVIDGQSRLGAVVENGRVLRMSAGNSAAVVDFLPVSGAHSAAWNLPLLYFALTTLLLALLRLALARWWPRAQRERESAATQRWYRRSRWVVLLQCAYALGWLWIFLVALDSNASFDGGLDATLRLLQLVGVLAIAGIAVVAGYVRAVWSDSLGSARKLCSVGLLVACVASAWFSFSLHLLQAGLNY